MTLHLVLPFPTRRTAHQSNMYGTFVVKSFRGRHLSDRYSYSLYPDPIIIGTQNEVQVHAAGLNHSENVHKL
jgi:hypothetical protein